MCTVLFTAARKKNTFVYLCLFRAIPSNSLPAHAIVTPLLLLHRWKTPPEDQNLLPLPPARMVMSSCSRSWMRRPDVTVPLTRSPERALRTQRSCPRGSPRAPQQGSRDVGEGLLAEHLDDAVARRVADVERLEGTLVGRRRKGRRGWGGEAGGRWKRQRIAAVPLCPSAT